MRALDPFQDAVLRSFFSKTDEFFLTGGAALAGFHLGHRTTKDLDLFTSSTDLGRGVEALQAVADELGATLASLRTSPDFRRFLVTRQDESVVVDLVRDRAPQIYEPKLLVDGVVVDPPQEILANKLCTLLSRGEVRDLVDVIALERAGLRVEDALEPASRKDGGLTPAQLAWVLSQITIGPDARIPGGITATELRGYLEALVERLTRAAYPSPTPDP